MVDPLKKTFDFLAAAGNPFAPQVLAAALEVDDAEISSRAVSALLKRGDNQGFIELIRRYESFPPEVQTQINKTGERMEAALQEIVQSSDNELCRVALQLIERAEVFSLANSLIKQAQSDEAFAEAAMKTVLVLADRLYERLSADQSAKQSDEKPGARNRTRQSLLKALVTELEKAIGGPFLKIRLEALLIVGSPEDAAIRDLFAADAFPEPRELMWTLMQSSTHAGVMQYLVAALSRRSADDRLLAVFQGRRDAEFALHLLRALPRRLSSSAMENLRRLKRLGWIDVANPQLEWVPPGLQGRLVDVIAALGLQQTEKLNLLQWVIRNGSIAGRIAAVSVLSSMNIDSVESAVLGGLDSEDVDVQAWATSQLREANVPEAFTMLVERLDSEIPEVQKAAREELESFDLQLMLGLFDQLRPEICRRAGELMFKIHPEAVTDLVGELNNPMRRKKERAIRGTRAMGLQRHVTDTLVKLLNDDDLMIRRGVIDALSDVPSSEVRAELVRLLDDESPRIREAAAAALNHNDQQRAAAAKS